MLKTKVDCCDQMISEFNYLIVKKELDIKIMTKMQITTMEDENNPKLKVSIGTLGKQVNRLNNIVETLIDMRQKYVKAGENDKKYVK